jgi:hypothetical protein
LRASYEKVFDLGRAARVVRLESPALCRNG